MNKDQDHLKLLVIGHYIAAALTAVFGCFPLLHVFFGVMMVSGAFEGDNKQPPAFFGWMLIGIGLTVILSFWALAAAMLVNAIMLKRRKNSMLCMILAGIECLLMPWGTLLGVFTIVVLQRDSVKELFNERNSASI